MSLFALYSNFHFPITHLLDFTLVLLFQLASTNSVLIEPVCFCTRWKCARLTYHPDILLQTELQLIPFYANFRSLAAPKIFRRLPGPSICFRGNWQNQTEFHFLRLLPKLLWRTLSFNKSNRHVSKNFGKLGHLKCSKLLFWLLLSGSVSLWHALSSDLLDISSGTSFAVILAMCVTSDNVWVLVWWHGPFLVESISCQKRSKASSNVS